MENSHLPMKGRELPSIPAYIQQPIPPPRQVASHIKQQSNLYESEPCLRTPPNDTDGYRMENIYERLDSELSQSTTPLSQGTTAPSQNYAEQTQQYSIESLKDSQAIPLFDKPRITSVSAQKSQDGFTSKVDMLKILQDTGVINKDNMKLKQIFILLADNIEILYNQATHVDYHGQLLVRISNMEKDIENMKKEINKIHNIAIGVAKESMAKVGEMEADLKTVDQQTTMGKAMIMEKATTIMSNSNKISDLEKQLQTVQEKINEIQSKKKGPKSKTLNTASSNDTPPEVIPPEVTRQKVTRQKVIPPKVTPPRATSPRATSPKATPPRATSPKATPPRATSPKATPPKVSPLNEQNRSNENIPMVLHQKVSPLNDQNRSKENIPMVNELSRIHGDIDHASKELIQKMMENDNIVISQDYFQIQATQQYNDILELGDDDLYTKHKQTEKWVNTNPDPGRSDQACDHIYDHTPGRCDERSISHASGRCDEHAHRRIQEHANGRAKERTHERILEHTSRKTNGHTHERTSGQTNGRTHERTHERTSGQTNGRTHERTHERTLERTSSGKTNGHTHEHTPGHANVSTDRFQGKWVIPPDNEPIARVIEITGGNGLGNGFDNGDTTSLILDIEMACQNGGNVHVQDLVNEIKTANANDNDIANGHAHDITNDQDIQKCIALPESDKELDFRHDTPGQEMPYHGSPQNYEGNILMFISDFSTIKMDAINGKNKVLFSESCYSSLKGYKMCMSVYPNGDGVGKGTHLSVFFMILKGDNDSELQWPFNKKIKFSLFDNTSTISKSQSFYPNGSASYIRPIGERNMPQGLPCFVEQDVIDRIANKTGDRICIQLDIGENA